MYERVDIDAVATVPGFCSSEGVAIDKDGRVYGGGRDGIIRRRTEDGHVEEFARCARSQLGGLAFDRDDNLFVCNTHDGLVQKVDRRGNVTTFAERAGDMKLWLPNFPVFDADGNLWVSNSFDRPTSQVDWNVEFGPDPHPWGSLARFRPDGSGEVIATGLYLANGIAIDPAEEHVYVLQSTKQNCVRVPLNGGPVETYSADLGAMPDGMAFDADGVLVVTLPWARSLVAIDPTGAITTIVVDPVGDRLVFPTNCAFAGPGLDSLYVAQPTTDHMAFLEIGHPGQPLLNLR